MRNEKYSAGTFIAIVGAMVGLFMTAPIACQPSGEGDAELIDEKNVEEIYIVGSSGGDEDSAAGTTEMNMCSITNAGQALLLAEAVEVDPYDGECEDRPYYRSHVDVELDVWDQVAGEGYEGVAEIVAVNARPRFGVNADIEEGHMMLTAVREYSDTVFLVNPRRIAIEEGVEIDEITGDSGTVVYDVPSAYNEFKGEAQEFWGQYEELCGHSRVEPEEEILEEKYFGDYKCPSEYEEEEPVEDEWESDEDGEVEDDSEMDDDDGGDGN